MRPSSETCQPWACTPIDGSLLVERHQPLEELVDQVDRGGRRWPGQDRGSAARGGQAHDLLAGRRVALPARLIRLTGQAQRHQCHREIPQPARPSPTTPPAQPPAPQPALTANSTAIERSAFAARRSRVQQAAPLPSVRSLKDSASGSRRLYPGLVIPASVRLPDRRCTDGAGAQGVAAARGQPGSPAVVVFAGGLIAPGRGSRTSRRASPRVFTASTVTVIARPGKIANHQASST